MSVEIIRYRSEFHSDLALMLREYLAFTAIALRQAPWHYEVEIDEALSVTLDNLSDYSPPKGEIFIAVDNGIAVGTTTIKMIRADTAELKRMYVRPEFQGRKIGEALLEKSLETSKEFGAVQMLLDTPPPFEPAHKLYKKFGFEFCREYPEVGISDELKLNWLYMVTTYGD